MLRRLNHEQPDSFAFAPANLAWAEAQMTKFPEGRQASAIIPLLWRAQEQEGWLSKPAIEYVADMLDMPYIRALEVATFYFMFQLQPVGSVAHVQICGTTSCMICGAEDLMAVCKDKIAAQPHAISADGKFSWEEVECLGACTNAPMVQIGKDFYEDLTVEIFSDILDAFARGEVPAPGPQNGRFSAEPKSGLTSLNAFAMPKVMETGNGSTARALALGETIKRIDGTEEPLRTPWLDGGVTVAERPAKSVQPKPAKKKALKPAVAATPAPAATPVEGPGTRPAGLDAARDGKGDDLKLIKGVGPKLEALCNRLGFYHFDQIAAWAADEVAWVDQNLEGFKGRVTRDDWVAQAKILADGGQTAFSAKKGKA